MRPTKENQAAGMKCPNCRGGAITTNYFTGEVYCLECGLVLG